MPEEVIATPAPAETNLANLDQMTADDYRAHREARTPIIEELAVTPKPSAAPESEEDDEAITADDSETPDPNDQEKQPKKKGGFQKRIDKLTREKAELEARLAGNTPAVTQPAAPAVAKPNEADPTKKPESKDFDTYEAYIDKFTDWKADQREKARAKTAADAEAAVVAKTAAAEWQANLTEARTRYEDFDKVALSDAPISEAVHNAIVTSENGADLAYYLGQNPGERERINALSPVRATLALGKILSALDNGSSDDDGASSPETKTKVSAAPAPIKPLGSKGATAHKRYDDMSGDEYRKARESGKLR